MEIGREGDFDLVSPVRKALLSQADAVQLQTLLAEGKTDLLRASAKQQESGPWSYNIWVAIGDRQQVVGQFAQRVNDEIFAIAKSSWPAMKLKPPPELRHLYVLGVRSVVIPEDSPELAALHEPWATSGFLLAPLVKGLPSFPVYRRLSRSHYGNRSAR
jgi:hypothetical protein